MLAARTQSQIDSVVDEVKALGATAVAFQTDVTSEAQVQAMVARTIEELGAIDIMVNNAAGSGEQMELLDMPMEKWDYTLSATLRSTVMCSKYALQHMVPRRSGTVINNASRAGRIGLPGRTDYSPAKAGVIRFTHALAREMGSPQHPASTASCRAPSTPSHSGDTSVGWARSGAPATSMSGLTTWSTRGP